jgi:predicted oxidoreductase
MQAIQLHAFLDIGITTFDHADIYFNYSCWE